MHYRKRVIPKFRELLFRPKPPIITAPRGRLDPYSASRTFVVVCGAGFDQRIPNAAVKARLGYCQGFEQINIPYMLVNIFELAEKLSGLTNPICWIAGYDYQWLNQRNFIALKRTSHIVWVNTWFKDQSDYYRSYRFPDNSLPQKVCHRILDSQPNFIFTISPTRSFDFYEEWVRHGVKLISLPLACDTSEYSPQKPDYPEFEYVKLAFVGGYWSFKAQQFDRYLKPYQDELKVFGYQPWPYKGYSGQLPEHMESSLYRQARVSPTINEPHVETMNTDLNERVFKILGSGGLSITDVVQGYREWFNKDELMVPESINEYHEMVHLALEDDEINQRFRENGLKSIINRHTYAHRAKQILDQLKIPIN